MRSGLQTIKMSGSKVLSSNHSLKIFLILGKNPRFPENGLLNSILESAANASIDWQPRILISEPEISAILLPSFSKILVSEGGFRE